MKILQQTILFAVGILSQGILAQNDVQKANGTVRETSTTIKDTQETVEDFTNALGGLFGGKSQITYAIVGIGYADEDLSRLYSALTALKGVKKPGKDLSSGTVSLRFTSKDGASGVWDQLSPAVKKPFKVVRAQENGLVLQYGDADAAKVSVPTETQAGQTADAPASQEKTETQDKGTAGESFPKSVSSPLPKSTTGLKPGDVHPDAVVLGVDDLGSFNDGAAIVKKGMSTAIINSKGEFLVPFNSYSFMGQFLSEGIQNGIFTTSNNVGSSGGKNHNGFVDSKGKPFSFEEGYFSLGTHLGRYLLMKGNIYGPKTYFYDKTGKVFSITNYAHRSMETNISKGCEQESFLFLYRDTDTQRFGFRNVNDKIVIQPVWEEANCFMDGAAMVGNRNEFGEMKYGFIDATGKVIVPLMFSKKPENFSDGLAKVYSNETICSSCPQRYYSYINKKGDFVINSKDFQNPGMVFSPFFHGYAFSNINALDKQGNIISTKDFFVQFGIPEEVIQKKFGVTWDFKNIYDGKMLASFKGSEGRTYKWYHTLLDLKNKKTLFLWYADAKIGPFDPVSGLARVEEYGEKVRNNRKRVGYINEDGVFVIVKGEASKW